MTKILIVDDEDSVLRILSALFQAKGYQTQTASDGGDAMEALSSDSFDILLTDVRMRPMDGLALLKLAKDRHPDMPVIMLTAYASVESAIDALKHGAFDYITKPFDVKQLVDTVDRALDYKNGVRHKAADTVTESAGFYMDEIVAESVSMRGLCDKIAKIAPTDSTLSIIGEAGCSKGLLASTIHSKSKRKDKPFVRINCAVMPEPILESELLGCEAGAMPGVESVKPGLFERARGGTILFEEIGCLPERLQEVLLKILVDKKVKRMGADSSVTVNARVLVSSNADIENLVKKGAFREDLFFKMNVVSLRVKPLRERTEDIVPLFAFLLGRSLSSGEGFPEIPQKTQAALRSYDWPGNAEELENSAVYAAQNLHKGEVTLDSLPSKVSEVEIQEEFMKSEPIQAKALKAFLISEGADDDLRAAEEEVSKAQEDADS